MVRSLIIASTLSLNEISILEQIEEVKTKYSVGPTETVSPNM